MLANFWLVPICKDGYEKKETKIYPDSFICNFKEKTQYQKFLSQFTKWVVLFHHFISEFVITLAEPWGNLIASQETSKNEKKRNEVIKQKLLWNKWFTLNSATRIKTNFCLPYRATKEKAETLRNEFS